MKSFNTFLIISVGLVLPGFAQEAPEVIPTAGQMQAYLTQRPEQDMIHWKDPARGESLTVRILEVNDTGVRVQKTAQAGLINRVVPHDTVSGVSFTHTPIERQLIQKPSAEAVGALRVLWDARKATLDMDTSNVAQLGIALAKSLRMKNETAAYDEAAETLQQIGERSPADHHKLAADMESRTLEMARALAAGSPDQTDRIAWEITEVDADPEAMLMATAWLGDRHFEDLKQLEEEHPRWDMDDEVRPIRLRLYHLSLDFALYPSLFHGTHEAEASTGLRKAWQIHQHTQSPQLAMQVLEDLAALYPDSQAAKDTANELARMRASEARGAPLEEVAEEGEPDEETEGTRDKEEQLPIAPPKPERYNLFDD